MNTLRIVGGPSIRECKVFTADGQELKGVTRFSVVADAETGVITAEVTVIGVEMDIDAEAPHYLARVLRAPDSEEVVSS